jgi:predicted kinase
LQNFEQIGPYMTTPAERQALASLLTWTEASLHRLESEFDRRRDGGFVRECHGDLHLGNIAWLDGEVRAFDGIEFNANLRWIDVMSEAAFLFMDLSERGRRDFAWRFLNGYLEGTGDYAGMGLLDFYLVYRAMVRAKVGRMRAAQAHLSAGERAAAMASFAAYLRFARRCSQPRRPLLIISHGLSASGKSSVTQALLEKRGGVRVRSDLERKRLHGLPADARTQSATMGGIYGADATERTYRMLFADARSIVAAGHTAIVDASFLDRRWRDQARQLAGELQVPFLIVHCHASEAELRRRLAARAQAAADPSEANAEILAHQIATEQPLAADERVHTVALNTEIQKLGAILGAIEDAMARRKGPG